MFSAAFVYHLLVRVSQSGPRSIPYVARALCTSTFSVEMYVYLLFLDDNKTSVVEHDDVEDFNPVNVTDFDPSKTYSAFWGGDAQTSGGYYDATIIHMTERMEDMEAFTQKRVRKPTAAARQLSAASLQKRTQTSAAAATKRLRRDVAASEEAKLVDSMAPDQPPTTSAWSEEKEKKLKWLEKEVARLRKLNDGLQQALSAKVLDADQRLYCVTSTGITMTAEFQAEAPGMAPSTAVGDIPVKEPADCSAHARSSQDSK